MHAWMCVHHVRLCLVLVEVRDGIGSLRTGVTDTVVSCHVGVGSFLLEEHPDCGTSPSRSTKYLAFPLLPHFAVGGASSEAAYLEGVHY